MLFCIYTVHIHSTDYDQKITEKYNKNVCLCDVFVYFVLFAYLVSHAKFYVVWLCNCDLFSLSRVSIVQAELQ